MAAPSITPRLVVADEQGNIYDHPELLMLIRRGAELALPRPDELMPLPDDMQLFLMPKRRPIGLDNEMGEAMILADEGELAVAAVSSNNYTIAGTVAYFSEDDAPILPNFAYGAVGFDNDRFYVAAKNIDDNKDKLLPPARPELVKKKIKTIAANYPKNRLMQHLLQRCAFIYACPNASNLVLGRQELVLPIAQTCSPDPNLNAAKQMCADSCAECKHGLSFTPSSEEVVELMLHHLDQKNTNTLISFEQDFEPNELSQAQNLKKIIELFKAKGEQGKINLKSLAVYPQAIELLAEAGLSSVQVGLNSLNQEVYNRYNKTTGASLEAVRQSIKLAKQNKLFVSLELLFFAGISDTEPELEALTELIEQEQIDAVQWHNIKMEPELYLKLLENIELGPCMGLNNFRKRLKKAVPQLIYSSIHPSLAG